MLNNNTINKLLEYQIDNRCASWPFPAFSVLMEIHLSRSPKLPHLIPSGWSFLIFKVNTPLSINMIIDAQLCCLWQLLEDWQYANGTPPSRDSPYSIENMLDNIEINHPIEYQNDNRCTTWPSVAFGGTLETLLTQSFKLASHYSFTNYLHVNIINYCE